jgi:hypothetical protein
MKDEQSFCSKNRVITAVDLVQQINATKWGNICMM